MEGWIRPGACRVALRVGWVDGLGQWRVELLWVEWMDGLGQGRVELLSGLSGWMD